MKNVTLLAAAAALALSAGASMAQDKKQVVIVVKGLDNPFFEAINQGCQKWNSENADSEYECFYTGPASTSDEAGEAQIIQDMLAKPTTAAIAISPSNAPLHAQTVKSANPTIPVMTIDADFTVEDAGVRATYLGTDNYLMGFRIGEYIKEKKPDGGTICSIQGNAAADNILRRAQGMRDALSGTEGPRGARRQRGVRRLDRGGGLPGLHQRRRRQGRAGDDRHPRRQPRPRRLRHHGRLAAVRRAAALPRPDAARSPTGSPAATS